ncbi:unnamed protein product [Heligmosomoides polygyrus]|uniref:Serine/threonine-protein phosphatase n=1 Tax=Heligmosomoides polygyrus TaxID=6339 RepID=A0A183G4I0_HELPZ|nr:unnamed protein product [Heligmosomoides polygyrus]
MICMLARQIFMHQPMLLELEPPLKIAGDIHGQFNDLLRLFTLAGFPPESNYLFLGDIHGQFNDLLRLFTLAGFPPESNYLFLGDYVDRGPKSIETIALLLCYKIKYPNNFFLLRGNHEVANLNRIYGFHDECKRRYSVKLWKTFQDVFNCMPVAALIDNKIFCCHGGLSPTLRSLDQLKRISRPCDVQETARPLIVPRREDLRLTADEPRVMENEFSCCGSYPVAGLLCDILWSDPDSSVVGWAPNERGVSYVFGVDVLAQFLQKMDLDIVVRGHQVCALMLRSTEV